MRTNQLDLDEEVMFKARQYLYNHVRQYTGRLFYPTMSMAHPHDPYSIPASYWNLYRDEDTPLPCQRFAQEGQDPYSQRPLKVIGLWSKPLPEERIRAARRVYLSACNYVDAQIGALLATLEECGLADDTTVVFSGDHGDMFDERGLRYKMHWLEMAARVPLLVYVPARFVPHRIDASISTVGLLPILVELVGGQVDLRLLLEGRSLLLHLCNGSGRDEAIGKYTTESTPSPLMMTRRDDYKLIYSEQDPCLLYDLHNDPQERENPAASPAHRGTSEVSLDEAWRCRDTPAITRAVLGSQCRRRLVVAALARGRLASWDHQPRVDTSQQHMCDHIDLDDLECRACFPQP